MLTNLPADSSAQDITRAQTFVSNAQLAFNEKDIEAACAVYAPDAVLSFFTNNVYEHFNGLAAIRQGWEAVFTTMPRFTLAKQLLLTNNTFIVNEWRGSVNGRSPARGNEIWQFNQAGQVIHHRLYSFLNIHPADSWRGRFKFSLGQPLLALQIERKRRTLQNLHDL